LVDVIRGKYRIVREIARSNDIVYEAVDNTLGRRIALKELNIASSLAGQARRERIERFNREARAAGKLSHPSIVSVTDFFEENGRYFIVMEYLEGQTLRDVMQVRGALPLQEAIGIACQMLDALAHAHQHKVIHRDIKPDNIFILPGGFAKLADFGIARLSEEPALTSDGQVFGTPSYMSPEQIEGRGIDHRSDLFSVGVLLYEMLTGRKPFVGDSVISITYAVMNADPPPMNGVPLGVEQVIRRALNKNPNGRQVGAEQMKQDLRIAEQTPAVFLPPSLNQTGMGRTGMGQYGQMPSSGGSAAGYGGTYGQASGAYGYNPPQMPAASYPPHPAPQSGLPWSWNAQSNTMNGPAVQPSVMPSTPPYAPIGYPASAHGVVPYASPPYPVSPPAPVFVLTPGGRTFLVSILAAAVIGGGIAIGVIGLQNGYAHYQQTTVAQRIAVLIEKGAAAYKGGDYAQAAVLFAQALEAGPSANQRTIIHKNLAYSYVQEARAANGRGEWQTARDLYLKAIDVGIDYDTPHKELAALLAQHGDTRGAEDQRNALPSTPAPDPTPTRLDDRLPPPAGANVPEDTLREDPQQFMEQRRAEARTLIEDGKSLLKQNRLDEAREKWQEAMGKAPATQEHDEASQLLDQYPPPASDPGY
jgi:serine/threonine protein kinase